MRADPEKRLSDAPITIKTKNEKTTWKDIALGIYIGGIALTITLSIVSAITYNIYIEQLKIEMDRELKAILDQRQ